MAKRFRAETRKGMRVTTVALGDEMHRRLAIAAIEESTVMTEIVRRALSEWLERRVRMRNQPKQARRRVVSAVPAKASTLVG